jgi:hypothetical protein
VLLVTLSRASGDGRSGAGGFSLSIGIIKSLRWPSLPYQSEDHWIVSQTGRAVIDLAQFERTSVPLPLAQLAVSGMSADPAKPLQLRFRVGSRDVAIELSTYVWDPGA